MINQDDANSRYIIRALTPADCSWVEAFATEHWGSDQMVVHGATFLLSQLPGFCVEMDGSISGLVTYIITHNECEITSLDSLQSGLGIGSALIQAVREVAVRQQCHRLHLTTTNDNIEALLFYQKRGFVLSQLRCGAVMQSRQIKPEIPLFGNHNIPIRDEIELEIKL